MTLRLLRSSVSRIALILFCSHAAAAEQVAGVDVQDSHYRSLGPRTNTKLSGVSRVGTAHHVISRSRRVSGGQCPPY